MKKLIEKRAELQDEMDVLLNKAETENRAMTDEEVKRFDEIEAEINAIDVTIAKKDKARSMERRANPDETTVEERAAAEEKAFCDYVIGIATENRASQLTEGANGVIVPTTIANRIIEEVKAQVPFFQYADLYETAGKLSIPVYAEDAENYISADYVDEGTDLTDNVGKFITVDLEGFVIGALALLSNKLKNNTDIDVSSFIVKKVSEALSRRLMKEFSAGAAGKINGVINAKTVVTAGAAAALTYDDLVNLKQKLPQQYREKGVWVMHPNTYAAVLKLKDGNQRPYFEEGKPVLNRPVIESEDMPEIATKAKAVVFGDLSGYAIKGAKGVEVQILREKFATKNMLGILGFAEYDGDIEDNQKIAVLQMA
ncbi:MAG: phage major capsid protein [Oscillospiraceae bacterium]|nr:phage major capsid protein [Oscillospiraceae bacterium]